MIKRPDKEKRRVIRRAILECVAVMAITIILFEVFSAAAIEERGYAALGGECLAMFFPLIWYAVKLLWQDIKDGLFISKDRPGDPEDLPQRKDGGRA